MSETDYTLDDAEQAVRDSMAADDRQESWEFDDGVRGLQFILDALAASQAETAQAQQRIAELEQERNVMRLIACEAYEHWDADRDSKVGKLLAALGGTPGIRVDLDKARSEAVPHA